MTLLLVSKAVTVIDFLPAVAKYDDGLWKMVPLLILVLPAMEYGARKSVNVVVLYCMVSEDDNNDNRLLEYNVIVNATLWILIGGKNRAALVSAINDIVFMEYHDTNCFVPSLTIPMV